MMISDFSLKNFKCFNKLELHNLKPITLISGKNNVGKTSLLDAVYFANRVNNPNTLLDLHITRGVPLNKLTPENLWGDLLFGRNISSVCEIKENVNGKTIEIKSETKHVGNSSNVQIGVVANNVSVSFPSFVSEISVAQSKETVTTSIVGDNSINQNIHGNIKTLIYPNVIYLDTHRNHNEDVIESFGKIDIAGNSAQVVDVLKLIEPPIKELSVVVSGGTNQIFALAENSPRKVSLKSMGDGLNRLMEMVITVIANPKSIILIDEIENGFHYSLHKDLWKVLSKAAVLAESQLIVTTHSYECISAAGQAVKETGFSDDFLYIRIDKEAEKFVPKYYGTDLLLSATNNAVEVR